MCMAVPGWVELRVGKWHMRCPSQMARSPIRYFSPLLLSERDSHVFLPSLTPRGCERHCTVSEQLGKGI